MFKRNITYHPCSNFHHLVVLVFCLAFAHQAIAGDTLLVEYYRLPYRVRSVASDKDSNIWISGGKGLQLYDGVKFITKDPDLIGEVISFDGSVISIEDHPLYQGRYPVEDTYHWSRFLSSDHGVYSAATDKQRRIWVCNGEGLFIFETESRFEKWYSGVSVRGILFKNGVMYANTYKGIYRNDERLFPDIPYADGRVVAYNDRIYFLTGDMVEYDPVSKLGRRIILSETTVKDSVFNRAIPRSGESFNDTLWIATTGGLAYLNGDSVVLINGNLSLESVSVENGELWVLSRGQGVYVRRNFNLQKVALPDGVHYSDVEYFEESGAYYFATNHGILKYVQDSISFITRREGLANNEVYSVIIGADGNLWASTYSGISRIDPGILFIDNFLTNVEFNRRSFFKDGDDLFFGSTDGVYKISPLNMLSKPNVIQNGNDSLYLTMGGMILLILILVLILTIKVRKNKDLVKQLSESNRLAFLSQIEALIMSDLQSTTVETLATKMGVSPRSLYRQFDEFGIKPGEFLREKRMQKAFKMQEMGVFELDHIASVTGYSKAYLKKSLFKKGAEGNIEGE